MRTLLTNNSDPEYLYQAQFRNEQAYEPERLFGITNVRISRVNFEGTPPVTSSTSLIGKVYTGPFTTPFVMDNNLIYNNFFAFNAGTTVGFYGTDDAFFNSGYGLLGCSTPFATLGSSRYNGSTCAADGFTSANSARP